MLKVPQTLNFSKSLKIAEFQGIKSLCLTKSKRVKLYKLKIYSKTFQNIIKLMDNRTYIQFKNSKVSL